MSVLIGENKDIVALVISLAALGLSVWSTRRTISDNGETVAKELQESARLATLGTFQRIHEVLIGPTAARGRRQLFEAYRDRSYPVLGTAAWDEINYSLALYDTLGGYLRRGEVPREAVLRAWHHPLKNIAPAVEGFRQARRAAGIDQPWSDLEILLKEATEYVCECPAVTPGA